MVTAWDNTRPWLRLEKLGPVAEHSGMAIVVAGEQFYSGEIAATVQLFYVAPEARGGRAALLLVRALRRWAHEAKATDLLLHVTSGIDAARTDKFLRKMGFRQTGGNYVLEGV